MHIRSIVSYTYPTLILDAGPSTFVNKILNCVLIALSTSHVQGGFLMKKGSKLEGWPIFFLKQYKSMSRLGMHTLSVPS